MMKSLLLFLFLAFFIVSVFGNIHVSVNIDEETIDNHHHHTAAYSHNKDNQQVETDEASGSSHGLIGELVWAQLVHRHGARTPVSNGAPGLFSAFKSLSTEEGVLTSIGKLQHNANGRAIKARYGKLLSSVPNAKEITYRSTSVQRVLDSAQAVLKGLYPNYSNIGKIIPVTTIPVEVDRLLAGSNTCPATQLNGLQGENQVSMRGHKLFGGFVKKTPIMNQFAKAAKLDLPNEDSYYSLIMELFADNVLAARVNKIHLPKVFEDHYNDFHLINTEQMVTQFKLNSTTGSAALLLLQTVSNKLKDVVQSKMKKDSKVTEKLLMFSAHDTTVSPYMNALNLVSIKDTFASAPFAILTGLELREKHGKFYVNPVLTVPKAMGDKYISNLETLPMLCPTTTDHTVINPYQPNSKNLKKVLQCEVQYFEAYVKALSYAAGDIHFSATNADSPKYSAQDPCCAGIPLSLRTNEKLAPLIKQFCP